MTYEKLVDMIALNNVSKMTVEDWKEYWEQQDKQIIDEDIKIAMEYELDKDKSLDSLNNI
jgi:hypothetical protein